MKKLILILNLVFVFQNIYANDGWTSYQQSTDGNIFSNKEHPNISLNKEALIFEPFVDDGSVINVAYEFENHDTKTQTVEACFPVIFKFNVSDYELSRRDFRVGYFDPNFESIARRFFSKNILNRRSGIKIEGNDLTIIGAYHAVEAKSEANFSINEFQYRASMPIQNILISEGPIEGFQINQDGNDLEITNVKATYEITDHQAIFTFYFFHKLQFQPKQVSFLHFRYWINNLVDATNNGDRKYKWNYTFTPAKTWKGNITNIYFITQSELIPGLPSVFDSFHEITESPFVIHSNIKQTVYFGSNFKPDNNSNVQIAYQIKKARGSHGLKIFSWNGDYEYFNVIQKGTMNGRIATTDLPSDPFLQKVITNNFTTPSNKTISDRVRLIKEDVLGHGDFWKISHKLITTQELRYFDKVELRLLRNMYFAARGKLFKSSDLQIYFSKFSWYKDRQYKSENVFISNLDMVNINNILHEEEARK